MTSFLLFKARGGALSPEEVQARISDRRSADIVKSPGGVAVLPVHGVISQRMGMMQEISGGTSTDGLAEQFRAALADDTVKAIIFHHDSPGGGTYGVDELASEIRAGARREAYRCASRQPLCVGRLFTWHRRPMKSW